VLATHSFDLASPQAVERFEYDWYQWSKIVDVVARRHHDHDADGEPREVLLGSTPWSTVSSASN